MDKNSITGIILIALLMVGYFYFFPPTPPPPDNTAKSVTEQPSSPLPQTNSPELSKVSSPELTDSTYEDSINRIKFGDFYDLMKGEGEIVTVTTDELTVNFNTKGGVIESAYLNNHRTFDSLPLPIVIPHPNNEFFFDFPYFNRPISTKDLVFSPSSAKLEVHGADSATLILRASLDQNRYLDQIYSFTGEGFALGYDIEMRGMKEGLGSAPTYDLHWKSHLPKTELAIKNMRQKTSVAYRIGNDVEKMTPSDEKEEERLEASVKWVSFKGQFFSHILMAEEPLDKGNVEMRTPKNEKIVRVMEADLIKRFDPSDHVRDSYMMYLGPNSYSILNEYDEKFEDQLDLGWSFVAWINVATTYIFEFLETYISNYGIIIIILSIFIRMLMFPLSYKSYVSMAKMRVLNATPEMKELDAKYKDDAQKLQMAKMSIYKEMGVSMFGGCLPMLLSYPFLIALFFFFPQSVELRQQSFLWANDLSTYDSILNLPFTIPLYGDHISLFTMLMALSTFVYTYYQQQSQPATGANAQMKYIAYFMPIFLLVFLNSYASGLSLYYFMSNLIQIIQTTVIRKFIVNDEKLLKEMRDTQKNLKKKGGKGGSKKPKGRIEKWMEKQQKKQQETLKQKKASNSPNRRGRRNVK
ncbi:MAG: membrane protein insertase YidC [Bacteroidota bacterium]